MAASSRAPTAPRVASVSGSRLTTTSACGEQRRQLVGAVDPVARAPGDADHLAVEGGEHRRERPADRAEAEDEDAQVRRVAELDELPVPARLLLGAPRARPWRRPGSRPSTHSAIARSRAPRALHRVTPAGTRSAIQSTPADSTCTTRSAGHLVQRGQVLPARDDELDVGAGLGDDLDPGRRRAEPVAVVGPGLHAAGSTRGSAARRRSRRSATSPSSRLRSSARSAAAMASEMRSVRASACA